MDDFEPKHSKSSEDEVYDEEFIEELAQNEDENIDSQNHYNEGCTGGNSCPRNLNKVILNHLKQNKLDNSSSNPKQEKSDNDNPDEKSNAEDKCDMSHIKEVLKLNFEEIIPKQSGYERFQLCMLKTKSSIPVTVTVSLIQFLGLMYIFTYCLPLAIDDYNNTTNFFYTDVHRIEGIRKAPQGIRISILVLAIFLYLIVNISLAKAINTPAGSLPPDSEWDIQEEVIQLCKSKGQSSASPLDDLKQEPFSKKMKSVKNAVKRLEKASQEKYFAMNMLAVDVEYTLFSNRGNPCVAVKGVEENLALKFHNKFKEISKIKTSKSYIPEVISLLPVSEQESALVDANNQAESCGKPHIEEIKDSNQALHEEIDYETEKDFSETDSLMSKNLDQTSQYLPSNRKDIFPIFQQTYEVKIDGNARICIRCLKSKPDRCHHCSICNQCIRRMDHHCPWLNNCIGLNNYKYFFNIIFYCTISCLLSAGTYWEVWIKLIEDDDTNVFLLYLCTIYYFLVFIFSFVITCFTIFHVRLMITNYTTLEYCEKRKENVSTWQTSPYYSTSWRYNVSNFLGDDFFLLWFIPIAPTQSESNGFYYKIFDESKINESIRKGNSEDSH